MARITGFVIGELRGKLGGMVFARNRRGAYVRSFVSPVDPATQKQLGARSAFTSATGGWHTLTDAQKMLWMDYASQYFSSKNLGNLGGSHSGINAFVSLRNTLLNIQRKTLDVADLGISINGVAVTVPTQASVILPTVPPVQPFQPVLGAGTYAVDSAGPFVMDDLGAGTVSFNLVFTGGSGPAPVPPSPTSANLFEDANGSNLGIAVYASNALAQASQFVQNPNAVLLSSTGLISGYTTTPAVPSTLEVAFDVAVSSEIGRITWAIGQSVRLDVYVFNDYGESARIGSQVVEIS